MGLISAAQWLKQIATPSRNPSAGETLAYWKSDNKLYAKDSAGLEALVGNTNNREIQSVRLCSWHQGNIASLSTLLTIDGITTVAGDRVLINQQDDRKQNGVYIAATGAWTRATDADATAEIARGTVVRVREGNANRYKLFMQGRSLSGAVGTEDMEWRVCTTVDLSHVFDFPTPQSSGYLFWNQSQRCLVGWDGLAWVNLDGWQECTSTARPMFTGNGFGIYETDTGMSYVFWDGAWRPVTSLVVQDENANILTGCSTIDFQGPGVSVAVGAAGEAIVTITGGSSETPITIPDKIEVFSTVGAGVWTKPPGCIAVEVEVQGGGGAGGGVAAQAATTAASGAGGGGGGYVRKKFKASELAATEPFVVGAGASATAAGSNDGGAGGDSSFGQGSYLITGGGGAGGAGQGQISGNGQSTGGGGGSATGGDLNIRGQTGGYGRVNAGTTHTVTMGGDSVLGHGSRTAGGNITGDGAGAFVYGGGGGGGFSNASQSASAGGAGTQGVVIVRSIFGTPPVDGTALAESAVTAKMTGTGGNINSNATQNPVVFTSREYDTGNLVDLNNNRFVVPHNGYYRILFTGLWAANATQRRVLFIYVNGVEVVRDNLWPTEATVAQQQVLWEDDLKAGDLVTFGAFQINTGAGALNFVPTFASITETAPGQISPDAGGEVYRAVASALTDLTAVAAVDIPGLSVTLNSPGPSAVWVVNTTFDAVNQVVSTAIMSGDLLVDGVAQQGQIQFRPINSATGVLNQRASVSQTWMITGLMPGAHTLKMQGKLNTANGTIRINATHSTMVVQRVIGGSGGTADAPGTAVIGYADSTGIQSGNWAETVWTADTAPLSVTFVAPPSGKVKITYTGYVANLAAAGNAGNAMLGLAWSGGLTRDPVDTLESLQARASTVGGTFSRAYIPPEALTPGVSYTLTAVHKVTASALGYLANRGIVVEAVGSGPYGVHGAADTGWQNLTLVNSWEYYGSSYDTPQYRRINGIVYLKGLVRLGTAKTIATLPEGFRPGARKIFAGTTSTSSTSTAGPTAHTHNNMTARVDVNSTGDITQEGYETLGQWVSLENISFPAMDFALLSGSSSVGEAVEGDDTGWIVDHPGIVAQTGWALNAMSATFLGNAVRRVGNKVYFQLYANRTGAAITGAASGNITDSPMVQFPAGFYPTKMQHTLAYRATNNGGMCLINNTGMLTLTSMWPSTSVATGNNVTVSGEFLID